MAFLLNFLKPCDMYTVGNSTDVQKFPVSNAGKTSPKLQKTVDECDIPALMWS